MKCPRCPGQLKPATYEGMTIDGCPQCGGTWLDSDELKPILLSQNEKFSIDVVAETLKSAGAGISKEELGTEELCPKCSSAMTPRNYNYVSGIVIDVCPRHGLWLDKGELSKLQVHWEHWEKERKEKGATWEKMLEKARHDMVKQQDQDESRARANLGPISSVLDQLFHFLGKRR